MEKLKKITSHENQILQWTETEAMKKREFLVVMLRESGPRLLISKKMDNFDLHEPTAQDLKLPLTISDKSTKSDHEGASFSSLEKFKGAERR